MDMSYRQDLLLQQSTYHFNLIAGFVGFVATSGVFTTAYLRCAKKYGIKEKDAMKYYKGAKSLASIAADSLKSRLKQVTVITVKILMSVIRTHVKVSVEI